MLKTVAKLLYKACPRCHGDLVLDEAERRETGACAYECLQCGRTTLLAQQPAVLRQPLAA
jgi:hypothetical protein